jgi:hypothetical protein
MNRSKMLARFSIQLHAFWEFCLSFCKHDALLLACARMVQAEWIYTWNVKHFQMVAPDPAERIVTP